jgi:hypothetical protein
VLSTRPKKRPEKRLATVGVVLSAVALPVAPSLVVVGLFLGFYGMMNAASEAASPPATFSLPTLGVWGLLAFAVALPGLFVSLLAWLRAGSAADGRSRALVGVALAAAALLCAASVAYSCYGIEL